MNQQSYPFEKNGPLDFSFVSKGPKGLVRKIVRYTIRYEDGMTVFNLGFGDDDGADSFDDMSRTNNLDKTMVLATVAKTAIEVIKRFPDMRVYAVGATPARTRLYQIAIANQFNEIKIELYIYGKHNGRWIPFEPGINFTSFIATKHKLST